MTDKVLAVIPAYNEALNIERVAGELIEKYPAFDYVIVNDGSSDETAAICRRRGWKMIDLPVNLGLAAAFQTGLKYAHRHGYRYAIQFDGDGQHRPEYIASMKEKIDEGYDIVIGSRFVTGKRPGTLRMFGSRLLSFAIWLTTGVSLGDPTSGMRMFSRNMIREFAVSLNYGPEPDTISYLIRHGARVLEVPVVMEERILGESYFNPVNAVLYMGKMLFSILLIQNFRTRNRG